MRQCPPPLAEFPERGTIVDAQVAERRAGNLFTEALSDYCDIWLMATWYLLRVAMRGLVLNPMLYLNVVADLLPKYCYPKAA